MIFRIKRLLYRLLPAHVYVALVQRGFFLLFDLGLLRSDARFKFHYAAKKLIRETDIVLDIGANLGYFSKLFARINSKGKLYSIEPIPLFFNRLHKIISKYPHVELVHAALGNQEGHLYMVMPEQGGIIRTGLPHVVSEEEAKTHPKHLQVPVLDAKRFLAGFERLDFIKCDIEGYEWTVFSELGEHLQRLRPMVQVEIAERYNPEFIGFFKKLGYVQCGLYKGVLILEDGKQQEASDFLFIPKEKQAELFLRFKS
jgi:FkbM family methyltransferase